MRFRSSLIAFSLSAAFLAFSPSARASGISVGTQYLMTVEPYASGENNGSFYVGDTTIVISTLGGTPIVTYTNEAFCIDFLDEISVPSTYKVIAQAVGSAYDSSIGGPGQATLELEAALGAQFDGKSADDSNYQEAIWNMSGASYSSAGVTAALLVGNANIGNFTGATGDYAFEEISGDGQSFMEMTPQPPTPPTPEPSSLILLGTGLVGMAGVMRRKLGSA